MTARALHAYRDELEGVLAQTGGAWHTRVVRSATRWALERVPADRREDMLCIAAALRYALDRAPDIPEGPRPAAADSEPPAPAPSPEWRTWPVERFVGTLVQRAFQFGSRVELLWAEVVGVTVDGYLGGRLRTQPTIVSHLHIDSRVSVSPTDVLDLMELGEGWV